VRSAAPRRSTSITGSCSAEDGHKLSKRHGASSLADLRDAGIPAVAQREPGPGADVMRTLARTVAARMSVRAAQQAPAITIS